MDTYLNNILHGDCWELIKHIPDETVDFVLVDPPYARKHVDLYRYLAEDVARVMKPGASLITIVGHATMPQILRMFEDSGKLRYRWPLCMWQPGKHAKLSMGVEVCWKPMLWFVKDKFPNARQRSRGFVNDGVEEEWLGDICDGIAMPTVSGGTEKNLHKWEQPYAWASYYIERLTAPGEVVFDPMVGSGTVADAAVRLGRQFIAFDVDEKAVETARLRVEKARLETSQ